MEQGVSGGGGLSKTQWNLRASYTQFGQSDKQSELEGKLENAKEGGGPLGDTGVQLTKPTTGYKCHAPCYEQAQRSGAAEEAEAEQTKKAN